MKQIKEMTDAELQERLNVLKGIAETEELCAKIEAELKEREAARQAEKVESEKEAEKALRRKQHEVIGKFYRIGDAHYKVVGVVFDRVFLEYSAVCNVHDYKGVCKAYTVRNIDTLLTDGKEVTEEEYVTNKVNINDTVNSLAKAVNDAFSYHRDLFTDWIDAFRGFGGFHF